MLRRGLRPVTAGHRTRWQENRKRRKWAVASGGMGDGTG
ncbi:hypothetical protein ERO13_A06G035700v2 [Gossypium hirsutum]|nr:hypothetical protein ERO13_A06G035700v2 [Gossypium hirsutum]